MRILRTLNSVENWFNHQILVNCSPIQLFIGLKFKVLLPDKDSIGSVVISLAKAENFKCQVGVTEVSLKIQKRENSEDPKAAQKYQHL